ncbi:MAG: ornithine cyclodeaminase [Pseudomonadota bacterium]
MSPPFIGRDIEPHLDWLALTDALAAGHDLPKAQIGDTFLYRRDDTLLGRSAWIDGLGLAVKTATIFPRNPDAGLPVVGGAVSVFSDETGVIEAFFDFALVTKWKTAGDSLLAARKLAPRRTEKILIAGAGVVAESLREAYGVLFPSANFTVWARNPARAAALAERFPATQAAPRLEAAVREADIVSCATMATDPLIEGAWLRPGQHIDLIGAYRPDMREADDDVLRRGQLFVDSRDTTLEHIGELKIPLAQGVIQPSDVVADYYDLARFTRAPEDITVFKNGGGAHLDLMTCRYILAAHRSATAKAGA